MECVSGINWTTNGAYFGFGRLIVLLVHCPKHLDMTPYLRQWVVNICRILFSSRLVFDMLISGFEVLCVYEYSTVTLV